MSSKQLSRSSRRSPRTGKTDSIHRTGCEAHGYENMAPASSLAALQLVEATARFRLWGVNGGTMRTTLADFCDSPDVGQVLRRADVVLVNNEVYIPFQCDAMRY